MDKATLAAASLVIKTLSEIPDARQVIKFISPTLLVRVTRPVFVRNGKKKVEKGSMQFVMHIGKPNFKERLFVKACKKAGEPFPVKKAQIRFAPKAK